MSFGLSAPVSPMPQKSEPPNACTPSPAPTVITFLPVPGDADRIPSGAGITSGEQNHILLIAGYRKG